MDDIAESEVHKIKPIVRSNGTFENPFQTWQGLPTGGKACRFLRERMANTLSRSSRDAIPDKAELDRTLPVHKPDLTLLNHPPKDKLQYMWIGHASVLYQSDGWNIMTDPIWSARCSPLSFMGPKRYREPPLAISELPNIDVVLISHNHYDHLDYNSVLELNKKYGRKLRWCVPQGLKGWFEARGCESITELSWWENTTISDSEDKSGDNDGRKSLEITCTPAQHWSLRTGCDRNQSLWSSWVMKTSKHNMWFSGDTAYCEAFEAIGQEYGPFDLAAIAIGAYCPRYFMSAQHIDPEQALQIHSDLKSKLSIGIHWGTFPMGSTEPYLEPRELVETLQEGRQATFVTVEHGAVKTVES